MAKFYGTLQANSAKTNATKSGHRNIKATAQSYDGSISVELFYPQYGTEGELLCELCIENGTSKADPRYQYFEGPLWKLAEILDNHKNEEDDLR